MATYGLGVRIIPSERIDPASMKRGRIYSYILNRVYANSTVSVLQTERARNFFPEKVRKNSVIIYNPVTVHCNAGIEREKIIITAGRLEKQKNHKMLIAAFERFHAHFISVLMDSNLTVMALRCASRCSPAAMSSTAGPMARTPCGVSS